MRRPPIDDDDGDEARTTRSNVSSMLFSPFMATRATRQFGSVADSDVAAADDDASTSVRLQPWPLRARNSNKNDDSHNNNDDDDDNDDDNDDDSNNNNNNNNTSNNIALAMTAAEPTNATKITAVVFGAEGSVSARHTDVVDYFRTRERHESGADMTQRLPHEAAFAQALIASPDSFVRARLFSEICDKRQLELRPVRFRSFHIHTARTLTRTSHVGRIGVGSNVAAAVARRAHARRARRRTAVRARPLATARMVLIDLAREPVCVCVCVCVC